MLDRTLVRDHQVADDVVVLAEHAQHLLRLGGLGERRESAQVAEEGGDLAPVPGQEAFPLVAREQIRDLWSEARQLRPLPLHGLVEPHVLDRDHDVVGERLDQPDLASPNGRTWLRATAMAPIGTPSRNIGTPSAVR